MITERQEELAALHAFGLLEGRERADFEAEAATNPDLDTLASALAQTASALAFAAPAATPPPSLRERIVAEASPANREPVLGSVLRFLPWGLAAALAVATVWLTARNVALQTEISRLDAERQLADIALRTTKNELTERTLVAERMINQLGANLRRSEDLARLKVIALASLAGNSKEAQAIAVWDPDQQTGLLAFEKLPALDAAQDYQLWVVDPAYANPVNGGVFHVDRDGHASLAFKPDQPVAKAAAFAISLERKGGVPKAEGPILMLGKMPGI